MLKIVHQAVSGAQQDVQYMSLPGHVYSVSENVYCVLLETNTKIKPIAI